MGKRGPTKTPTNVLEMRGSRRASLRKNEPRPAPGVPIRPAWLSTGAKRIWQYTVPKLAAIGVLTKVDRGILIRYCVIFDLWMRAVETVDKRGDLIPIKDKDDKVVDYKERPEVSRIIKLGESLLRLEAKLGLSPSDRAGLAIQNQAVTEDSKERFFKS